jgi:PncC family amidohydrolase
MMMRLTSNVLRALKGKTLVTAESCTGGGIGAALTAIPGSSDVYKGGVISYTNWVKENVLGVDREVLVQYGAVSAQVAQAMAEGVRKCLQADIAVSVTGLAGPGGDDFGNPVGTVYIGYCDNNKSYAKKYFFSGDRETVRKKTILAALELVLQENE